MTLPPLIDAMRDPGFYPHHPDGVELRQTHISYVFLAGDQVYKVKKPVRFRFLDFSTLELRRHYCREEVRLNRRLAPDTYLGIVGLRRSGASYRPTGEDDPEAIEYAVRMRRLPADRIMADLLDSGRLTVGMIDALCALLVAFHRGARGDSSVAAHGQPSAIERVVGDSFASAHRFRDKSIPAADDDAIQSFCRGFLERRRPLLEKRVATGRIREGHGDLHSEHVCFGDRLAIFDCVEFRESLRCCDVASEIAFLAMDLEYHRRPDLAARLVSHYAELADDGELSSLVPFYACHRAYIRGLVDALAAGEPEVPEPERAELEKSAERHFRLAYRYIWADRRCLIVVGGLSGSGKSTLAAALEERTGFRRWSSDVVRKEIAGLAPLERVEAKKTPWLYSSRLSAKTYALLYSEAERALAAGKGVILDATFQRRVDRDRARRSASRSSAPMLFVECRCEPDEIRRRLDHRSREASDPSDADWRIFVQQQASFEAVASDEPSVLTVDTTGGTAAAFQHVERELRRMTGDAD